MPKNKRVRLQMQPPNASPAGPAPPAAKDDTGNPQAEPADPSQPDTGADPRGVNETVIAPVPKPLKRPAVSAKPTHNWVKYLYAVTSDCPVHK